MIKYKYVFLVIGWIILITHWLGDFPEPVNVILPTLSLIFSLTFLTMHIIEHIQSKRSIE